MSEDEEGEQRIINECSMIGEGDVGAVGAEEDPYMLMTGRSESAIEDEDEDVPSIAKCGIINASFINFKDNNLLAR